MTTPLTVYAELLHNVIQRRQCLGDKAVKCAIDRIYRMASELTSQKADQFVGSTITNAKFWSIEAEKLWNSFNCSTSKRRAIRGSDGKTVWAVEHQYPIGIFVVMALNGQMNTAQLIEEYLEKYSKYVIITAEENRRLPKTVKTLEEGDRRYSDANIEIVEFSTK